MTSMLENINELPTEMSNQQSKHLDQLSAIEIVQLMNEEDKKVAFAVEQVLPEVAKAVDLIAASMNQGGRLFYFGAGTSGRLGILEIGRAHV